MDQRLEELGNGVKAVAQIAAIPTLLKVLCESTGMRFAAVARVTEKVWTACAVQDDIPWGMAPGDCLPLETTLCTESRAARTPIVIEHASLDPHYRSHHTPKLYHLESYVTVPIILADGSYFGNLCALDPEPACVALPRVVLMFTRFAALIGSQLDAQMAHAREHTALMDERATSELREQFIAILGHDLRNPLQAVYATAELLQRKLVHPAHAELAGRIKAHAGRMSSLISDVLDFARGRLGGGIGLELTEVENVNAGLAAVVQELQDAHPDCTILSSIDVDRSVRCDLGRLQQVACNLLVNALTHGLAQSPVKIDARAERDDLLLEVWNAGDPIHAESLDKLFEPFWRHSVSAGRNGLGLGLHICASIVRAHEGSIAVTSTRENGTRFTVRLPLGTSPIAAAVASPLQNPRHLDRMDHLRAINAG